MRNEHDIFNEVKNSPDFEPRIEFVQEAKANLVQKARQMKFRKKVKRFSIVSSSIAATAILLVWISFLGGKQVIFDTVGSLLIEDEEKEIDHEIELSENGKIAKIFLERKGYDVNSYEGSSESYLLTLDKLLELPYKQHWSVQSQSPDEYIGKTIDTELFIVQGHRLDQLQGVNSLGKTRISVFLVDGIVIGGTSWPVTEEQLRGWVYSLDGQTLEELHGIDYPSWEKAWTEKYSDDRTDELPFDNETILLEKTETVFSNLKTTNWAGLANLVHPEKGLFFSFYADAGSPYSQEVHFTKQDLGQLAGTETFIWGYDMAEYVFEFTVNDYTSKFLVNHSMRWDGENNKEIDYDVITFNDSVVDSGGTINTIPEFFPEAKYVEYYSTPPSEELWHQWQALRFIYEEFKDEWYLIGIVRDVHSP